MKQLIALLCLVCLSSPGFAQTKELHSEKEQLIRDLMRETGADKMGVQMASAMVASFNQALFKQYPHITQTTIDKINQRATQIISSKATAAGGLIDIVVPIYDKYYTQEEIKQLRNFYQTDLGKKVIQTMPSIMQESMAVGQQWGQKMAPEIQAVIEQVLSEDKVDTSPK